MRPVSELFAAVLTVLPGARWRPHDQVVPADTDFEYAFPFAHYAGKAAPSGAIADAREQLDTSELAGPRRR